PFLRAFAVTHAPTRRAKRQPHRRGPPPRSAGHRRGGGAGPAAVAPHPSALATAAPAARGPLAFRGRPFQGRHRPRGRPPLGACPTWTIPMPVPAPPPIRPISPPTTCRRGRGRRRDR